MDVFSSSHRVKTLSLCKLYLFQFIRLGKAGDYEGSVFRALPIASTVFRSKAWL
jgi:hypothetical protein